MNDAPSVQTDAAAAIARQLVIFHADGEMFEIRALYPGERVVHRNFNKVNEAAAFAAEQDNNGAKGVYFAPNVAKPDIKLHVSCNKGNIVRRHWLLIDCDSKRDA